jgi:hypothetical protein
MNLGETMVEEEADELLQEAEINADGNVDYMSFVKGLFSNLWSKRTGNEHCNLSIIYVLVY